MVEQMASLRESQQWVTAYSQWTARHRELMLQLSRQREVTRQILSVGRNFQPLLEAGRQAQRLASTIATAPTLSFYPPSELAEVEELPEEPPTARGKELAAKLRGVPPGRAGWFQYQDLCEEILNHCLVPPLMECQPQSPTSGGLHIRDLIFHIPFDTEGFWLALQSRFDSIAVIVECKNYTNALSPNQVVISSKYLGRKRLGRFGIIASRVGLSVNALKQQRQLWIEEDKFILSLTDRHLLKMLELRDKSEAPSKVIDAEMRRFLEGLE